MSALGVGVPTRPGCGALSPLPASPEWQKPVPLSPQLPCGTSVTSSSQLVFSCRAEAGGRAIHIHAGSVMGGGAVGGVPPHHWETMYLPGHLPPLFETLYKTPRSAVAGRTKAGWEEGGTGVSLGSVPEVVSSSTWEACKQSQEEPIEGKQRPLQSLPDSDSRTLI